MNKIKLTTITLALAALTGCANIVRPGEKPTIQEAPVATGSIIKEIDLLPAPDGPKIAVAVYNFKDLTGQRKIGRAHV